MLAFIYRGILNKMHDPAGVKRQTFEGGHFI